MKVLVVDDEIRARDFLRVVLNKIPGVEVVGLAEHGEQAIGMAKDTKPDLVFMDIQMPGISGLEAAKEMLKLPNQPHFVFVTAYDQYAVDAFKVGAIDYLVKPFSADAVRSAIERFEQNIGTNKGLERKVEEIVEKMIGVHTKKLPIPLEGGNVILVDTSDILYIERSGLQVLVKTTKKTYETNINLKDFEQKLDPRQFFRCHKGYIVRLDLIEEIVHSGRSFELLLTTGDRILLSREKEKQLRVIYGL